MPNPKSSRTKEKHYNYLPATLRETKKNGRLIEYYVENPNTGQLERMRIRVNGIYKRFPYKKDAKLHIYSIVSSINMKLSNGWNPFYEHREDSRLYSNVDTICALYIEEKEKELRPETLRSYRNFCSVFLKWFNANFKGKYSGEISHQIITRFMDYIYNERNVSAVSYNNYMKQGRIMFGWFVEKCYCKSNPFQHIKAKKKPPKKRTIVDPDSREKVSEYLTKHDPNFLLVLKLIYSSLIRPNEIRFIKIGDINLEKHYIKISAEVAKNHNERFSAISEDIIEYLKSENIEKYPKNWYLFGSNLTPAKSNHADGLYTKKWIKLKRKLKLPEEMQLYSFRDTGIFDMLKSGIDDLSVMQHADHHSLEMTTRYANHHDPNLVQKIYENAPAF